MNGRQFNVKIAWAVLARSVTARSALTRPTLLHSALAGVLCLGLIPLPLLSQASAGAATRLNAGPTYTSKDGKTKDGITDPKYPNVDVVFDLAADDGTPVIAKSGDLKLFSQGKEIGVAKSLRSFEQTGQGLTAILAIDASGSMKGAPLAAIHASIAKFVGQARAQDRVEVITFADQTQIDVPFGASKAALTQELQTVQTRGKFTRLYDGLLDALAQFNATQPKRRQILVISDGHDEGSKSALSDVILKAKALGVVIDSIGLTKDDGAYLTTLQQLSQQTGGQYHRARTADDLEGMIGQGIQAKRATQVAAFKTHDLAGDEKLHSVQLHWEPANLSSTAFVLTPKYSPFSVLWIWGLGSCFFAGLLLLIFSLYSSRRVSNTTAPVGFEQAAFAQSGFSQPGMAAAGFDSAVYAPEAPTRPVSLKPTPYEPSYPSAPLSQAAQMGQGVAAGSANASGSVNAPRSSTLPDTIAIRPSPVVASPVSASPVITPPVVAPPRAGADAPASFGGRGERGKTQLAVFFEALPGGPFAYLEVKTGTLAGQSISINSPSFTMGAVEGNDAVLVDDSTVSSRHARLSWENSILKLEDLNSTNGTFLNDVRLPPGRHLLKPGDEITLGRTILIVNRG